MCMDFVLIKHCIMLGTLERMLARQLRPLTVTGGGCQTLQVSQNNMRTHALTHKPNSRHVSTSTSQWDVISFQQLRDKLTAAGIDTGIVAPTAHDTPTLQPNNGESGPKAQLQLVDVREPHEYMRGTIPSAVNVPMSTLVLHCDDIEEIDVLDEADKDAETIVFCQHGIRSNYAQEILIDNGFTNVLDYRGSFSEWQYYNATTDKETTNQSQPPRSH
eukprot:m.80803 g.80803  ORF g.80803 m.80803 type:complete len:217 (+) comp12615_c0_seq1:44-694(+)